MILHRAQSDAYVPCARLFNTQGYNEFLAMRRGTIYRAPKCFAPIGSGNSTLTPTLSHSWERELNAKPCVRESIAEPYVRVSSTSGNGNYPTIQNGQARVLSYKNEGWGHVEARYIVPLYASAYSTITASCWLARMSRIWSRSSAARSKSRSFAALRICFSSSLMSLSDSLAESGLCSAW